MSLREGNKKRWIVQVEDMQTNLTSGLNRFNRVMENVKEREKKLQELHRQMNKLQEEEALIEALKNDGKGSAGSLQAEIDYFEAQMELLSTERISLNHMKGIRKRDLEILTVPYLKDKDVLHDLAAFLDKETEVLVDDAKQIDSIRVREKLNHHLLTPSQVGLVENRMERKRVETQSTILLKDSIILQKNGANVERAIEVEHEFTQFKSEMKKELRMYKERQQLEEQRG